MERAKNMSTKRYFRITPGNWGGELTVGRVSEEFARYWIEREASDLLDHIYAIDDGEGADGFDPDSPPLRPDWEGSCYECDDLAHINAPFSDHPPSFEEVSLHPDAIYLNGAVLPRDEEIPVADDDLYDIIADEEEFAFGAVISNRDMVTDNMFAGEPGFVPALFVLQTEKGNFGYVFVETDGDDFDPSNFKVAVLETDLGEFVERYWYGDVELVRTEDCDTNGKDASASLGYIDADWTTPATEDQIKTRFIEISVEED
jgi:hypothetical protein